jgi:NRPS condensation-like uncharacterized protein
MNGTELIDAEQNYVDIPLTPMQFSMWYHHQKGIDLSLYNVIFSLAFSNSIDEQSLALAVAFITGRHGALRTRVCVHDGVPHQRVGAPNTGPTLRVEHLDNISSLEACFAHATQTPFDLDGGDLFDPVLFRAPEGDTLVLRFHHIISDGWSVNIVLDDLQRAYTDARTDAGSGTSFGSPPTQYTEYMEWLKAQSGQAKSLAYWTHSLEGAPTVLDLHLDRPRPTVMSHRGAHHALE